jgi:hypothetical protein
MSQIIGSFGFAVVGEEYNSFVPLFSNPDIFTVFPKDPIFLLLHAW